jgi:N-acyl homoserine lactone hydrolase
MEFEAIKNGYLECDKGMVTLGRDMGKKIRLPVFCFLVKHKKGNVLVDTGFSMDFKDSWGKRLGFYNPSIETDIVRHLKDRKIKIDFVINTHLHVDHCGNNSAFRDSAIIVQKRELESAMRPKIYQKFAYPDSIDKELDYKLIDGDFDLFRDGMIKIVPTYGHTRGHQSVLLDVNSRKIFIAGDACYTSENLKYNCLPGILWNPDKIISCYSMMRKMENTKIIFGHEEIRD